MEGARVRRLRWTRYAAGLSDCYRVPAERRKRRDEPPTLIHLSHGGNSIDDIIRPQGIVIDSKSTLPNHPAYPQQDKFRSRILSGENFSEKRKRRKTIRYIIDRKFREKNYIYFGIGDIVNRNGIFGRIVWKDLERFGRSKSRVAGVCVDSRRKKFQDTRWIVAQCRRMVFSGVGARTCHITEWNLCPMPSGVTSCR